MEVMHARCAGIDIAKASAKVCVRVQGAGRRATSNEVTDWGAMTADVIGLRDYLVDQRVDCVVMEATGDYWKPFYYVLEELLDNPGFELILTNARHAKNVPGRKSDVSDAMWLADLGAHGLLRSSFVPPVPIRELRDLTRARAVVVRERTRELNRLEKRLEAPGVKLSVVVSGLDTRSAVDILQAMVAGQRDPVALAALARPQLKVDRETLAQALTGRFGDHDAFMIGHHLTRITQLEDDIAAFDARIEVVIEPFRAVRDLLCTIPGISTRVADVVIAETGADMAVFPSPGHLAAWAGVAPGQNESAGKKKPARARPGDTWLKGALGIAAISAGRSNNTYLGVRFRRIAAKRGHRRAVVATERIMLVAIWHMLHDHVAYRELGTDHHGRKHPDRLKANALRQLHALGYQVDLRPAS